MVRKTYSGSRGQKGTGSRIRNTAINLKIFDDLGALGGENESLVVGPGGDAHSLRVHKPVVPYTEKINQSVQIN